MGEGVSLSKSKQQAGERGGAGRKVVAAFAGGLLAVGGMGYWGYRTFTSNLPHQVAAAQDSHVDAVLTEITKHPIDCRTQAVYNVAGTTALTKYDILGKQINGFGATITSGQVIRSMCIKSNAIKTYTRSIDGKETKYLGIPVDAIVYDTNLASSAVIQDTNPVLSDALKGFVAIARSGGDAACRFATRVPSSPIKAENCDTILGIAQWDIRQQALLRTALTQQIDTYIQKDCGLTAFRAEKEILKQTYNDLATTLGASGLRAEIVDAKGALTESLPNFSQSVKDNLYQDGSVDLTAAGSPQLDFTNKPCGNVPTSGFPTGAAPEPAR